MRLHHLLPLCLLLAPLAAPLSAQPLSETASPGMLRAALLYGEAPLQADAAAAAPQQEGPADPWFAMDKAKHFAFSFLWTVGTQYTLEDKFTLSSKQALPFSVGSTVAVGAVKEFYDLHYGPTKYFSQRDLVANAAGILAAAGFIWL